MVDECTGPATARWLRDLNHEVFSVYKEARGMVDEDSRYSRLGMRTVVSTEPRIRRVAVTDNAITAELLDGRVVSVPLAWSWRLSEATPEQRTHYELIGGGLGVHWPDVDEDISVRGMLHGIPASRPKKRQHVSG